jgi:hypothetical protein
MAKVKFAGLQVESVGAVIADSGVTASLLDLDAAYVDFDPTGIGYARIWPKRLGAGTSGGLKLRTLNAGVGVDAVAFTADGTPTFAKGPQVTAGVTALQSLTATTATVGGTVGTFTSADSATTADIVKFQRSDAAVTGALRYQVIGGRNTLLFGSTTAHDTAIMVSGVVGLTFTTGTQAAAFAAGVTIASGITVSAGGISVSAGTSAFQAVTATGVRKANGGATVLDNTWTTILTPNTSTDQGVLTVVASTSSYTAAYTAQISVGVNALGLVSLQTITGAAGNIDLRVNGTDIQVRIVHGSSTPMVWASFLVPST